MSYGFPLKETSLPKSKYEEDVYINNHTSVWGSWWKDHQWGYKCCKQTIRNSYCTGAAGIEASESAANLMKANIDRKAASEGRFVSLYMFLFILSLFKNTFVYCVLYINESHFDFVLCRWIHCFLYLTNRPAKHSLKLCDYEELFVLPSSVDKICYFLFMF